MRIKNSIILFVSILAMFSALFVNFIVIKSYTMINLDFINELDAIYFDYQKIPHSLSTKTLELLNSGNNRAFKKLVEDTSNPISIFYGFAGLMKSNRNAAIDAIENGILSVPKKVTIIQNDKRYESTLGYATILLLHTTPDWLSPKLNAEFIRLTEKKIHEIYQQDEISTQANYKSLLLSFIKDKYPKLAQEIINEFVTNSDISSMNLQEKREVSLLLNQIKINNMDDLIISLLMEKDAEILKNTLRFIKKSDNTKIKKQIETMLSTSGYSESVKLELINTYSRVFEEQAISIKFRQFLLANETEAIIIPSIAIYEKYADDSQWAFLTRYLGQQYSVPINNRVLEAIIHISWKENPDNVYNTLLYCIRRANYKTVIEAINFYIKNNISSNQSTILTRLRELDNDEIKFTALKYCSKFKITAASDIIITLSNDKNEEIQKEAKQLANQLSIKLNNE